jgi:hypothetical protein
MYGIFILVGKVLYSRALLTHCFTEFSDQNMDVLVESKGS